MCRKYGGPIILIHTRRVQGSVVMLVSTSEESSNIFMTHPTANGTGKRIASAVCTAHDLRQTTKR